MSNSPRVSTKQSARIPPNSSFSPLTSSPRSRRSSRGEATTSSSRSSGRRRNHKAIHAARSSIAGVLQKITPPLTTKTSATTTRVSASRLAELILGVVIVCSSRKPERYSARCPTALWTPWGARTPYARGGDWPIRVDEHTRVRSSAGCSRRACSARTVARSTSASATGGSWACAAAACDRVNHGRLGPKGLYGWQANNAADRLLRPLVRRDGELREASWDEAMELSSRGRASCSRRRERRARLLHERAALPRGLLHACARRAGRDRDEPPRRQHAALHRDGRAVAEGDVRLRRAAGRAFTTSSTATRSSMSGSTRPRRRRCSGCTSSTGCAARTRRARS